MSLAEPCAWPGCPMLDVGLGTRASPWDRCWLQQRPEVSRVDLFRVPFVVGHVVDRRDGGAPSSQSSSERESFVPARDATSTSAPSGISPASRSSFAFIRTALSSRSFLSFVSCRLSRARSA